MSDQPVSFQVALGDLVRELGGELLGDPLTPIAGVAALESARPDQICFLANPRYATQLAGSAAACVIVAPPVREAALARGAAIVTPDPYLYFARLTQWWAARVRPAEAPCVHPTAVVHPLAHLGQGVSIGPGAVVEAGARLADGCVIGAQCFVGADASVGARTRLAARVTLHSGCRVGERCIVHSGAVIGSDGFGFAPYEGRWEKIEQLGGVSIGNDVEIGANTCVDRGALGDTVLEDGVKLDNLIQIAHNVHIGAHTAMAANTGVAGSARIGAHCMIGGAANINGHISIPDHTFIAATTLVTRTIHKAGQYAGAYPFDETSSWEKSAAVLRNLHGLRARVRSLEKQITPPDDDGHSQDS